jgi:hypothetical protein
VRHHPLDVEIHRERVGELEQVGEPEARPLARQPSPGVGQAGELGVRGREHDDLAGRLAEVDRGLDVGRGRRLRA